MSVETVKARLATIQAGITGVRRAYAEVPNSITAADMPLFVTLTGPANHDWQALGSDQDKEQRTYRMRLFVMPLGQGYPGEGENAAEPFFTRVRDTFSARPGLEGLTGVQSATLIGDSGLVVLDFQEQQYWGIEFELQVVEYVEVTYAEGD